MALLVLPVPDLFPLFLWSVSKLVVTPMRLLGAFLSAAAIAGGAVLTSAGAQGQHPVPPTQAQGQPPPPQDPQQKPQIPTFRTGVDVIRLDVTVLDRSRRPVRGLTADDFTVVENGKEQRIVAVVEMAAADEDPTPSAWMRHVPADITANDLTDMAGDGRFVAIVMDDWNIPFDADEILLSTRMVGRYLIDQLGPSDVAAVIFPQQAGRTQDFTTDRQKLLAAIDKFDPPEVRWMPSRPMGPGPGGGDMPQRFAPSLMRNDCQRSQPTVPTLDTVVARLASVPNRRKTVILVTTGIPISFAVSRGCPGELSDIMKGVYRRAQQANVNIYSIDPAGQNGYAQYLQNPVRRGGRPADRTYSLPEAERAARTRREFMEITADHTGARAITNTNDLSHEIDQMLTEAASYYLVGYQTSNGQPDGKFRRLDVKVNRPDVTVRTRSGFYAPSEDEARPRNGAPGAQELGLAGMSNAAPLALRAQVLSLGPAAPTAKEADVAIVLGVRTPGMRLDSQDTLTLIRTIYDANGKPGPPAQEKLTIAAPPRSAEELRYEVYQHIRLAPGRYEVRLNGTSVAVDASGSVYAEFVVPDVTKRSLALSGLLFGRKAEGRTDPLAAIVPVVPTTVRDFAASETIVVYLRAFQHPAAPADVKVLSQVINISDQKVWEAPATIPASAFDGSRAAPFELALPLSQLARGQYLLSIQAELPDGTRTRSDAVFRVR